MNAKFQIVVDTDTKSRDGFRNICVFSPDGNLEIRNIFVPFQKNPLNFHRISLHCVFGNLLSKINVAKIL